MIDYTLPSPHDTIVLRDRDPYAPGRLTNHEINRFLARFISTPYTYTAIQWFVNFRLACRFWNVYQFTGEHKYSDALEFSKILLQHQQTIRNVTRFFNQDTIDWLLKSKSTGPDLSDPVLINSPIRVIRPINDQVTLLLLPDETLTYLV